MHKRLLLREYFILLVVGFLMIVAILSSIVTSHKSRHLFIELQQKKKE